MKPNERPTAAELRDGGKPAVTLAGLPAAVCPGCGCAMFAYRTTQLQTRVERYVECRNKACNRAFVTYQPLPTIAREVERH